jgi:P4 family phage/plasmid primase-like protien
VVNYDYQISTHMDRALRVKHFTFTFKLLNTLCYLVQGHSVFFIAILCPYNKTVALATERRFTMSEQSTLQTNCPKKEKPFFLSNEEINRMCQRKNNHVHTPKLIKVPQDFDEVEPGGSSNPKKIITLPILPPSLPSNEETAPVQEKNDRPTHVADELDGNEDDAIIDRLCQQDDDLENEDGTQPDLGLASLRGNDSGNADKLLRLYGDRIKYCPEDRIWYVYDGKRWAADPNREEMNFLAEELYKQVLSMVDQLDPDDNDTKDMKAVCYRLGNCSTRINMIRAAANKEAVRMSQDSFNNSSSGNLVVADNGIVDLRTGELLPFASNHYITLKTDITYNPNAAPPTRFLQFLDEIFCGDQELIAYVHRLLGYFLTGETKEQCFYNFHGTGSNGKSVLLSLLSNMFPGYAFTAAPGAFSKKRNQLAANPTIVQGKYSRMMFVPEADRDEKLDLALLKRVSGQDDIVGRELYKNDVTIKPRFKVIFTSNYPLNLDFVAEASCRRYVEIPFLRTFAGDNIDKDLSSKLWAEREGIFSWIVQGAVEWYAKGMGNIPQSILDAVIRRRSNSDSFYGFFTQAVDITDDDSDVIQARDLYSAYLDWCVDNDVESWHQLTETAFGRRMTDRGIIKRKHGPARRNCYFGLRVKETGDGGTES